MGAKSAKFTQQAVIGVHQLLMIPDRNLLHGRGQPPASRQNLVIEQADHLVVLPATVLQHGRADGLLLIRQNSFERSEKCRFRGLPETNFRYA